MIRKDSTFVPPSSSCRVLQTACTNPHANLATEEWLFEEEGKESKKCHILYLWRNSPTVVIGAHQNAYKECDLPAMERDGVFLARRRTGGGAVFHDLGNTNFSFLSPAAKDNSMRAESVAKNMAIITKALSRFGLVASTSGRNDIALGGRQVSEKAIREGSLGQLHHGTLLIDTD